MLGVISGIIDVHYVIYCFGINCVDYWPAIQLLLCRKVYNLFKFDFWVVDGSEFNVGSH